MSEIDLKHYITAGACETTKAGWIWYCDEHMTHGNADTGLEAHYMAECHIGWFEDEDCPVYIIDVKNHITYNMGEDYNDKTPNLPIDLDLAQKVRKELGLP